MASTSAVSTALYEFVGSFQLRRGVRSVEDLSDGTLIWEVLQDIDSNYFTGAVPEKEPSDLWVQRWQNLKFIHKSLGSYLTEMCGQPSPNIGGTLDVQAIAKEQSVKDMNLLLKLVLLAAISSSNAGEYVMRMPQMSITTQTTLKDIITEMQESTYDQAAVLEGPLQRGAGNSQDLELAFEERVGKVIADNERLQGEKKELQDLLDSMHDRHAQLQEKHDTVQRELDDSQERLLRLRSGADSVSGREEAKTKEQEHIIASLESKHASAQAQVENLRRQNETLRLKGESAQKLQDDFDEIKIERDQLLRKANTAEKYKQKLQQSQDWEKQNTVLQAQVEELKRQLRQSDSTHFSSSELEREIDEYRKMLPRIEQDRHELAEMKKRLEYDNHVLMAKLEHANQQQARDAATIDALRERVGGSDGPGTPTTPRPTKGIPSFDEDADGLEIGEKPDLDTTLKQASDLDVEQEQIFREAKKMSEAEMNAISSDFQRKLEALGITNDATISSLTSEYVEHIESANRSTQRVMEYARRQTNTIGNLRSELTSRPTTTPAIAAPTPEMPPPPPPKESKEKEEPSTTTIPISPTDLSQLRNLNSHLSQELKLMSSAWYNLASRLQSPNVSVVRARAGGGGGYYGASGGVNAQELKSWIGRRRGEVERAFSGVGTSR